MIRHAFLLALVAPLAPAAPIIGGDGAFKYQYMPDLLKLPAGAKMVNGHALEVDAEHNIYLNYVPDQKTDHNCLVKWKPDGTGGEYFIGSNTSLCAGTPHGLKIANEDGEVYFYHANNNKKLVKTYLNGSIVWEVNGNFGQDPKLPYRPTWHSVPPNSKYHYVCDGYGSSNVYVFDNKGNFMNKTYGGKGTEHGKFNINHGCTYDARNKKIAVSDRANHRIEYYDFDPESPDKFEYSSTIDLRTSLGNGSLPCNMRMYPDQDGRAIIADLAGPVAVLDNTNKIVSIVKVSELLPEHKTPHDAIFLPNGDMVVTTYSPGRISYWKKLPTQVVV